MPLKPSQKHTSPKVGAIVVNWRSREHLKQCLACLASQERSFFRIVVVDNDEGDESGAWLHPQPENLHFFAMGYNAGFARANNHAAAYLADCDWIALVNPDAFLAPSWLGAMLDAAERHPEASFFACRLVMAGRPGFLDGAGDIYHASGLVWRDHHGRPQEAMPRTAREVFSPCAAAALYRRRAFAEAGGFDEDFFCYVEDVDLGFRLRLSGHRCRLVPDAVARHVGSAATGGGHSDAAVYFGHRNLVWTYVKNMPGFMFWALLPWHLMMNLAGVALFAWRGQLRVILAAKRDAVRGIPSMWRKRRRVQSQRSATARNIWKIMDKRLIPDAAPWRRTAGAAPL